MAHLIRTGKLYTSDNDDGCSDAPFSYGWQLAGFDTSPFSLPGTSHLAGAQPASNAGTILVDPTPSADSYPLAHPSAVDASSASASGSSSPALAATIPALANFLVNGFWQDNGTIAHHWASTTISYNINALTAAEQLLAKSALNAWHEVTNLNFVQTTGAANITYNHNGSMTAYETDYYGGSGIMSSATIDISADWITNDGGAQDGKTGIDSYGYQTYIHETGHALGLGHQGPYNGSANYSTDAIFANDTWQYSVMSYFSEPNYNGGSYRYVVTPQMADIYAVDSIYGAAATRTGNTVYGFHDTAGSIFDFTAYTQAPALTIYDSGGVDTLDCSGYSVAQTIDLHPGSFSSVGGLVHNIGIATNTIIDVAIGGSGNDTLIANDFGCTLNGGAGNDTLIGGAGNDTIIGGAGIDTVVFSGNRVYYLVTYNAATQTFTVADQRSGSPDGTDTVTGVENFHFADGTIDSSVVAVPPQPDLTEYVSIGSNTVAAGGSVVVDAYAMNLGNAVSGASTAGLYLSTDATITTSDMLLATVNSGALTTIGQPGYYDHQTLSVMLPGNLAPGTYYIGGISDYTHQVSESNETNNTYNVAQIMVSAPAQPDLTEYVSVGSHTVTAGGTATIDAYAMNVGNGVSAASIAGLYLSTDATITTSDTLLATVNSGTLTTVGQPGYYDHQTLSVTLPGNLAPGSYYIGGISDYTHQISESNETNNTYNVAQITVLAPPQPDLTEYVAVGSSTVAAGASVAVDAYAMNVGNAVSAPSTAHIYLSTNATITSADTLLATVNSGTLTTVGQSGYYDHQTVSVTLPGNLAPGTYYIGGIADDNHQVSESNETNNTYNVAQLTVTAPAESGPSQPDLSEYTSVGSSAVAAGGSVTVDAYAMNIGNGVSAASTAGIYLSTHATITTADTLLATVSSGMLTTVGQPGYYDHQTLSVTLPGNLAPGTYYIGGISDYNHQVSESNETNNTYNVAQLTVTAPAESGPSQPDLSEYTSIGSSAVAAGGSVTVDAYAMNIGNGVSAASTAGIYLSTHATITTADTLLATVSSGTLTTVGQPGYYDHQTLSVTLPGNLAPGTYYIGGISDYNHQVSESNETNNTYNVAQITVAASAAPAAVNIAALPANHVLTGGPGGDTFVFAPNFGNETIANFQPGQDQIQIDHAVFATVAALMANTSNDTHGNAVIAADKFDTIVVQDVSKETLQLHLHDFIIV